VTSSRTHWPFRRWRARQRIRAYGRPAITTFYCYLIFKLVDDK
jgi:hypothetical protein